MRHSIIVPDNFSIGGMELPAFTFTEGFVTRCKFEAGENQENKKESDPVHKQVLISKYNAFE
jgi:hypothetical protein